MLIKSTYLYKTKNLLKSLAVCYGVLLLVFIGLSILEKQIGNASTSFGGLGGATIIFMLVMGITSVSEELPMLIANGVSRKTQFVSQILSLLSIIAVMIAVEALFTRIASGITSYQSIFVQITEHIPAVLSPGSTSTVGDGNNGLISILWYFSMYFMMYQFGFFIASYTKSFPKRWRVWAGVGLGGVFLIALPYLDSMYFGSAIFNLLGRLHGTSPLQNALFYTGWGVVFAGIGFTLFRKINITQWK